MEFDGVQHTRQVAERERLRRELWEARAECDRHLNSCHRLQADVVRRSDDLRAARRDLEATRAELAAAHAELAAVRGAAVGTGECGGVVCVNTADPAGLGHGALLERLVAVGGARDRINGLFTEVAGEFAKRNGKEAAAWAMREYLRVSGLQARRDASLAGDLVEHALSDTVAALRRGEITAGHALDCHRGPQERHMGEADLLELSRDYPVDTCGRAARTAAAMQIHPNDDATADEAGDAHYRAQRAERRASLRRGDDGTPLSAELLAELATNAKVLPAIFDAKWANLALGAARNASDAQKLVLAVRDGGCISCGARSEETHAHHIQYWSDDGPTEIPNLASLCPRCHNLIHDHNWQVQVAADGHPKIRPPDHLRLPPEVPSVGELERTVQARPPDHPRLPPNPPAHTNPILRT